MAASRRVTFNAAAAELREVRTPEQLARRLLASSRDTALWRALEPDLRGLDETWSGRRQPSQPLEGVIDDLRLRVQRPGADTALVERLAELVAKHDAMMLTDVAP